MNQSKKLMGSALLAVGICGGVGGGVYAARQGFASRSAPSSPAGVSQSASATVNSQWRASQFAGVRVRQIPQPERAASGGALAAAVSIKVRSGAARPARPAALVAGGSVQVVTRGTTTRGGEYVTLPPSRLPLLKAQRTGNGAAKLDCDVHSHGD